MARDKDDAWSRMREREDERDQSESITEKRVNPLGKDLAVKDYKPGSVDLSVEKLLETLKLVEPMIEQLNNLYNQYLAGVEKRPPLERRGQLDQMMAVIQAVSKPTPSLQFKCKTVIAHYISNKERWERLLRDLEKGSRKRPIG